MAVPGKPSIITPAGPGSDARTFRFNCPASSAITAWHIVVAANADLTGTVYWNHFHGTGGITAGVSVAAPYAGTLLPTGGQHLWWQARAANVDGYGPWSTPTEFTAHPTPGARDPYEEWANTILGTMARPRTAFVPGAIRPVDQHVRELVTTDLGGRWRLDLPGQSPPVRADLAVVGMTVEVSGETGWQVVAVTGQVAGQGRSGDYLARAISLGVYQHWRLSEPAGMRRTPVVGSLEGVPGGAGAGYSTSTPWGTVGPDEPDGCLNLNGAADAYLEFGNALNFTGTTKFTLAGWMRPNDLPSGSVRVISKEAVNGYRLTSNGSFSRVDAVGTDAAQGPPGVAGQYKWTHFAAIYDGAQLISYLNGVPGTPVPSSRAIPGNTAQWTIGRAAGSVNLTTFFSGLIDEVSVWSGVALTPAQVAFLYGGGK